jgi:hypothetical protein
VSGGRKGVHRGLPAVRRPGTLRDLHINSYRPALAILPNRERALISSIRDFARREVDAFYVREDVSMKIGRRYKSKPSLSVEEQELPAVHFTSLSFGEKQRCCPQRHRRA